MFLDNIHAIIFVIWCVVIIYRLITLTLENKIEEIWKEAKIEEKDKSTFLVATTIFTLFFAYLCAYVVSLIIGLVF